MPGEPRETGDAAAGTAGEQCWYCRSAPAGPECAFQAPLYSDVRLTDVRTTVTGYRIEKAWNVVKVPVPRCARCAGAHATRGRLLAGFTMVPVLAVIVAALCAWGQLDGFIGVLVVSVLGGLLAAGLGWLVGRGLGRLLTPGDIPDEDRCRDHPAVQALMAQGWKWGSKPQPGEEFKKP
ncbi:MAG TPA: hypothetical protein PK280_12370 [Planctomycetota bacterium]|nr:hypothetical protein [Planctomycetota bacterium]